MITEYWQYYKHSVIPNCFPHEEVDISYVNNKQVFNEFPGTFFVRYTTDFDCGYETDFWACILNEPFDLNSLKAKRRYEINKGNKNFYCKKLTTNHLDEMYSVYLESLEGYRGKNCIISKESFLKEWAPAFEGEKVLLLGVFEKDTNILCGYAHCIDHGKYIPISVIKTRVSKEQKGVNFALIHGVVVYYEDKLANGSYLCDGWRNVVHETKFQDWLKKYFNFRNAYCILHIVYKRPFNVFVKLLYPFRKIIKFKQIQSIFTMEEWSRNCLRVKGKVKK